jgi:hypothetical protein
MSLRIRRGTDAQRSGVTFDMGEIVWTTDGRQLWVGDGLQQGGFPVVGANITGYGLVYDPVTRRIDVAGLTTNDIAEGSNNKYFSALLARNAAASLFDNPDATHNNISFTYDDTLGVVNATVTLDGIGITELVDDTTPELGGNLSLNQFDITGAGNIDITGGITISGTVEANIVTVLGTSEEVVTIDGDRIFSESGILRLGELNSSVTVSISSTDLSVPVLITESLTEGLQVSGHNVRAKRADDDSVDPGDFLYGITSEGWTGTSYQTSSVIAPMVDPFGTVTATAVPGMIAFVLFPENDFNQAKLVSINRNGFISVGHGIAYDAKAAVDINGLLKLEPQGTAPATPAVGMIAVANRTGWDPASVGSGNPYPVFYDGSAWIKLTP